MKECPRCHLQFPDTANFCPMDREKLIEMDLKQTPKKASGKIKFSETQWFMAATNAEELKDTDHHDTDEQTAKFARDVDIPNDVRDQYTLNKDAETVGKHSTDFVKAIQGGQTEFSNKSAQSSTAIGIAVALLLVAGFAIYWLFLR